MRRLRIGLLGATGHTGRPVLYESLSRGHRVTALARNPKNLPPVEQFFNTTNKMNNINTNLDFSSIEVYARDNSSITELVRESDVIISCIGGRSRGDTIVTEAILSIQPGLVLQKQQTEEGEEAHETTKKKIVVMTSIGCGRTSLTVTFALQCMFGFGQIANLNKADQMILEKQKNNTTSSSTS